MIEPLYEKIKNTLRLMLARHTLNPYNPYNFNDYQPQGRTGLSAYP